MTNNRLVFFLPVLNNIWEFCIEILTDTVSATVLREYTGLLFDDEYNNFVHNGLINFTSLLLYVIVV